MEIINAIILGIIQGLTEFLPISSTAHLTIAGKLMHLIDNQNPEHWTATIAVIQLGTLISVFVYFINEIIRIVKGLLIDIRNRISKQKENKFAGEARIGWLIIVGTVPVVIIGLLFKNKIEGSMTKNLYVIAGSMIILAVFLFISELVGKKQKEMGQISFFASLFIGFAQSLALIPGSSRSGTTLTAGLFIGLKRDTAARFSFLLSLPAVLASGLLEFKESIHEIGDSQFGTIHLIIATIVSFFVGIAAIWALLKYLKNNSTAIFIIYRIIAGIIILILLYLNLISN